MQVKDATSRHVEANSAYVELPNEAAELKRVSCWQRLEESMQSVKAWSRGCSSVSLLK